MFLRPATNEDAEMLLEWTNDPETRQNSFDTHIVSRSEHYEWFRRVLSSNDIKMYILCVDQPVGTVRVKYQGNIAELSYNIAPQYRGRGYGKCIIRLAETEIIKNKEVKLLTAEVKTNNIASRRIFQSLNYEETQVKNCFKYTKKLNGSIAFRADANKEIASGHIMRCVTYAQEAIARGEIVLFFVSDIASKIFVESLGMYAVVLGSKYNELENEIDVLSENIIKHNVKRLIVDSYYVTNKYLASVNEIVKTIYIDDLALCAYSVDALVNYNIYAEAATYKQLYKNSDVTCPKLLLGIKYAPLRREFENVQYTVREKIKDVLISTGGGDKFDIAQKIFNYLQSCNLFPKAVFHIVSGAFAKHDFYGTQAQVHKNVSNMAELMCSCDILIAAGGFTLYEACAVGIPTVSISFADNQLKNVEKFDELGLIPYMGDVRNKDIYALERIKEYILSVSEKKKREKISDRNRRLMKKVCGDNDK